MLQRIAEDQSWKQKKGGEQADEQQVDDVDVEAAWLRVSLSVSVSLVVFFFLLEAQ